MYRTLCSIDSSREVAIPEQSIDRLISTHWTTVAPFLTWEPELATSALPLLDDEVDAFVAEVDPLGAGTVGHEIARLLLRAVLTMRAMLPESGPDAIRFIAPRLLHPSDDEIETHVQYMD